MKRKRERETNSGERIKKLRVEKIGGYPRIEKRERKSQKKDVEEGMVSEIFKGRSKSMSRATKELTKPLRERTNIRAKEGVDGVEECVVGTKPPIADACETQTRTHGIHEVRTRTWHCLCSSIQFTFFHFQLTINEFKLRL